MGSLANRVKMKQGINAEHLFKLSRSKRLLSESDRHLKDIIDTLKVCEVFLSYFKVFNGCESENGCPPAYPAV